MRDMIWSSAAVLLAGTLGCAGLSARWKEARAQVAADNAKAEALAHFNPKYSVEKIVADVMKARSEQAVLIPVWESIAVRDYYEQGGERYYRTADNGGFFMILALVNRAGELVWAGNATTDNDFTQSFGKMQKYLD